MDKQDKQLIDDLVKKLEKLEIEIALLNKDKRNYTQKEVFTGQVVFRGSVYDKSGAKVIN